ncbi:DUF288 domain-containing protein [Undibacter mobilis]|uniref:DUF288 domain-containing protein n=2 Tax=Undibacter mobilis TaxID=2292256 RepID=A0A371B6C2_9BRAD|nr:DUF288 domain-containing protein [Undibacter mobilis]
MRQLAEGAVRHGHALVVVGDEKSPPVYDLAGSLFLSVADQQQAGFALGSLAPVKSYARKAIGYLSSIRAGHRIIVETDDDNAPIEGFWTPRSKSVEARYVSDSGWTNIYAYFSEQNIWPRGYPLDRIKTAPPAYEGLPLKLADAPIQQGLADGDPDVDAVYRLVLPLPQHFRHDRAVLAGASSWCPFNSQNTTWFYEAFPLLYLPFTCSMRMTDIYRGYVAQRVAWANGWPMLFHAPTVFQDRNVHDFMQDFRQEIDGYLNYHAIQKAFDELPLKGGLDNIFDDMKACYTTFIRLGLLTEAELPLLNAWIDDLSAHWSVNG